MCCGDLGDFQSNLYAHNRARRRVGVEVRAGGGGESVWLHSGSPPSKREREGFFFPFCTKIPQISYLPSPTSAWPMPPPPPLTSGPNPLQALPDLSPAARPPFRASWTPLTSGLPGSRGTGHSQTHSGRSPPMVVRRGMTERHICSPPPLHETDEQTDLAGFDLRWDRPLMFRDPWHWKSCREAPWAFCLSWT